MKKTTTLAQLHVRLEFMYALIDPMDKGRLRLPLAQPMVVQSLHKDTTISPLTTKVEVANIESDSTIIEALSEKDFRNVTTNTENKNEEIQSKYTSVSSDKVDKEIRREDADDITTMTREVVTEKTAKVLKHVEKEKHVNNEITTKLIVGSSLSDGNIARNTATAGSFSSNMTHTTSKSTLDSSMIQADSNSSTFEESNYTIKTSPIIVTNLTHNNNLSTAVSHNQKGEGEDAVVIDGTR